MSDPQGEAFHFEPGMRKCPGCGNTVVKFQGSSDIHCMMCSKYFCYYCGFGPCLDLVSLYEHMRSEHSANGVDGVWANPPDVRKYRLGEPVSDEELNEFYKKYPNIKADNYSLK